MSEPLSARVFRHRGTLLALLAVPVMLWALTELGGVPSAWELGLGAVTAALGVALRLASIRRIGRAARVYRAHASSGLVDGGPYRWTRNPLYIAAALVGVGLGLLAGGRELAPLLLPLTILIYTPVVAHEEAQLAPLLGPDYLGYQARTPRWLGVRWLKHPAPPAGDPVPWGEVLAREFRFVLGVAAGAVAVVLITFEQLPLRTWFREGAARLGVPLPLLVVLTLVLVVAANVAYTEHKRTRRRRRKEGAEAAEAAEARPESG